MGTYLTNDKMSPELRARIEASVRAGRPASARLAGPPPVARAALRLVTMTAIVGCIIALGWRWQQDRDQLETARGQLVAEHATATAPLAERAPEKVAAVHRWLAKVSGLYRDDHVATRLRRAGGLDRELSRGALYLRGPQDAIRSGKRRPAAIAESQKDAFVTCLVSPPPSAEEKALIPTVAATYRGTPPSPQRQARIHPLKILLAAQPVLDASWSDALASAASVAELSERRRDLERADLGRAAKAVEAELLVYVIDEPKKPDTPAEVDGAHDHMVRVGIVDLATSKELLRMRRRVEPSWISESHRVDYARGLNACRLAVDVRDALSPPEPAPEPNAVQAAAK